MSTNLSSLYRSFKAINLYLALCMCAGLATATAHAASPPSGQIAWTFPIPTADGTHFESSPALGIFHVGTTNVPVCYIASLSNLYALRYTNGIPVHTNSIGAEPGTHGALSSPTIGP